MEKEKRETIGSESYRALVRKARLDKDIKAIVFRINLRRRQCPGQ